MDGFYHGLESSLLAFGFALSFGAFALLASPPARSVTLPMLTVDVPQAGR